MSFRDFVEKILAKPSEPKPSHIDFKEKRRHNRVDLEEKEQLFLHLLKPDSTEAGHTLKAHVSNVSLRGCRLHFENEQDVTKLKPQESLTCSLSVDGFPIPLHVEVVRVMGPTEVAIVFRAPFPRELDKLEKFIEPRCLGISLREIRQDALQQGSAKGLRWFQGINDTEFFSWADPQSGEIIQQQLVFLEKVVEWKKDQPARTGKIQEANSSAGTVGWIQSELLQFDAVLNQDVLEKAKQVLQSALIDATTKEIFLIKIKD